MTPPPRIAAPPAVVRPRVRVGLGAAVVLVLVGLAVAALVTAFGASGSTSTVVPSSSGSVTGSSGSPGSPGSSGSSGEVGSEPGAATDGSAQGGTIFVHLLGAVTRPGLYELGAGSRAVDAVAAAGGFSDGADQEQLNLARLLSDGEQIYVPVLGELPGGAPPGAIAGGGTPDGAGAGGLTGKVNLNTADAAALDTLPGVGPATAQRILDWRDTNGRFTAIEDLLTVTGIGDKTFAELKDLVTV